MIDSSKEILLNRIESLCPEKWLRGETVPWIQGEKDVVALCERFKINTADIITSYLRRIVVILETFLLLFEERLLKRLLQVVPISNAKADRGFSQMNLVCTKSRSSLSVAHLSSLMFIHINGPPVQFWEASSSVKRWLERHASANSNRNKKIKGTKKAEFTPLQQFFVK